MTLKAEFDAHPPTGFIHQVTYSTKSTGKRAEQGDKTGNRYGRLEVIRAYGYQPRPSDPTKKDWFFLCKCLCDSYSVVRSDALTTGNTKSCNCYSRERASDRLLNGMYAAGDCKHPLYGTYNTMINRCNNPKMKGYKYYGGRNITVCDRWMKPHGIGFRNFLSDVGERPDGRTLDRINNDGNYEPSNVRWATPRQQANNQRRRQIK